MSGKNSKRDRADGWKHAKRSGHKNEDLAKQEILSNKELQERILQAAHFDDDEIVSVEGGGIHEKEVVSVFGDLTKPKADLVLNLKSGNTIGVSLKKSRAGQVYIISPKRFIEGFEKQYNQVIPENVKRAIGLYWGTEPDTIEVIEEFGDEHKSYEIRKHRVTGTTLLAYNEKLYEELLDWFDENMLAVFDFCFSKGLSSEESSWADLIWYKNELGENGIDTLINISDIEGHLSKKSSYGPKNGGSTIQLPFGFVQWHSPSKKTPGEMQFHHSYEKLDSELQKYLDEINDHS